MVVVIDTPEYDRKIRKNKTARFENPVVRYRLKPVVMHTVKVEKVKWKKSVISQIRGHFGISKSKKMGIAIHCLKKEVTQHTRRAAAGETRLAVWCVLLCG